MMNGTFYFCGIAAAMYIATLMVLAAVRWFHMCKPYGNAPSYYYPGRPYVVAVFISSLLLLPYVIHPEQADAWYLTRIYFLPFTIYHFIILQFAYFSTVMQWKRWRLAPLISGMPVFIAMVLVEILAIVPGDQIGTIIPVVLAKWGLYILGGLLTIICGISMGVVLVWAKRYDADGYSNPADFPVATARRWMSLVFLNLLLVWTAALTGSRMLLSIIMLLLAASTVIFTITVLHPNRNKPMDDTDEPKNTCKTEQIYQRAISKKKHQEILQAIQTVVVEQEAYLDTHLTIQDVADKCGYNRSYIAGIFKGEFGGFFNYINNLRLQHVETYLREHPGASTQEAALESGFNSRQAYYHFKGRQK